MNITRRIRNVLHYDDHKNILGYKHNGIWNWCSRKELRLRTLNCINVLEKENVNSFDRVVFKGNNSVDWVAWNIATNAIGAIWVPLYNNQSDDYVNHIIRDSKPKLMITNSLHHKGVNLIKPDTSQSNYDSKIPYCEKNDVVNLIYTSGTTGNPKGVILTHENILSNISAIENRFPDLQRQKDLTTLNILPWAHIYSLTTELFFNIMNENKIAISSGPDHLMSEIREIQPDVLYLVPRVLELMKCKLEKFEKPFIQCALPYILRYMFGQNLQTIFVGGAQLSASTRMFYEKYGIILCEGYGCTETSPMISVNHMKSPRDINSVGKVMDNLLIKIVDGEIHIAGPSVMKGYWKQEETNKEIFATFENNKNVYYKTGDEGYVKDGFLHYTGRIKDNYKLTNGKFVNVTKMEEKIAKHIRKPFMIYGANRPYNIIIIEDEEDMPCYQEFLLSINQHIDNFAHIKDILFVQNGTFQQFQTPKMSLKRKELEKFLSNDIESVYAT